jgi:cytochrome bd-type quinol oxidase subunit 2
VLLGAAWLVMKTEGARCAGARQLASFSVLAFIVLVTSDAVPARAHGRALVLWRTCCSSRRCR